MVGLIGKAMRSGLAVKAGRVLKREAAKPENKRRAKDLWSKVTEGGSGSAGGRGTKSAGGRAGGKGAGGKSQGGRNAGGKNTGGKNTGGGRSRRS